MALSSILVVVTAIAAACVTVIGFLADNASLRAALDTRTLIGVYVFVVALAVLAVLLVTRVRHVLVRLAALALSASVALVIGSLVLPRVWTGLTPDEDQQQATRVSAAQSPPIRVDRGSFLGEIHRYQDLRAARIVASRVTGSDFEGSNLAESDLRDSVFRNVNLAGVDLCAADLRGADLRGAVGLGDVRRWDFAIYDDRTKFPVNVDVRARTGPVYVPGADGLLYSCSQGQARELLPAGGRDSG